MESQNGITYNKYMNNHDHYIYICEFNIDNVEFCTGYSKNQYCENTRILYKYDDGVYRDLQIKTDFIEIFLSRLHADHADNNKLIISFFEKNTPYLTIILNKIKQRFYNLLLSKGKTEEQLQHNFHGFLKGNNDKWKKYNVKSFISTRFINHNISNKYKKIEDIKNISFDDFKRIIPKPSTTIPKEGAFILRPYFCCINHSHGNIYYGLLSSHTVEIKYAKAKIDSIVEHKKKVPKKLHNKKLFLTI